MNLNHCIELFENGQLNKVRNPKLKCPVCKCIRQFLQFDVNCNGGYGFIEGEYARAYRCPKCFIMIAFKEDELI